MKLPGPNKKPLFPFLAAVVLLLGLLLLFLFQTKKGEDSVKTVDTEIEGVNLTYMAFNKRNEKKLEIKCLESQKKEDDKLFMKKITATIFKANKLEEDIHVSADSGYAKNDFNDFHLQDNALVSSPSFTLSSRSFDLKDLNVLSTNDAADFTLRNVKGQAKNGLLYIFKNKYLKMFRPRGRLIRDGNSYDFQARFLRLINKQKMLHLDREALVDGENSTLRANRISLQFDQDFVNMEGAAAFGECVFEAFENDGSGRRQKWRITGNQIKMLNDPQGRLEKIAIRGDGKISLGDKKNNHGRIESGNIEIFLNSETQALQKIQARTPGTLTQRGSDNLTVSADSFLATYSKEGILSEIQAEKKCKFLTDDFSGTAASLDYSVPNARIKILGRDASVTSKKSIFNSAEFLIQTRLRQLGSNQNVKATLVPEKKNVLLRAKPVFVTAAGMEWSEKGEMTRFMGNVKLYQDEVELQAGELLFESRSNRISCRAGADLKFLSENEKVVLHGKNMVFHADALKIVLDGAARLQQGENTLSARQIELAFSRDDRLENIRATDQATFSKKGLTGKAQSLDWFYAKKNILFKNSAEIIKKDAGTIRGQELLFDLNSNEISVSSPDDRSETIIRQEMP
jgi:lipopolysaccharide export system protein LptA